MARRAVLIAEPSVIAAVQPRLTRALDARVIALDTAPLPGPGTCSEVAALQEGDLGAVILSGEGRPLACMREVQRVAAGVQIVLLASAARLSALQRELGAAPGLGRHWQCAALDDADLGARIDTAVRATYQRRNLRTTLDRINVQLARPQPTEALEFRRLFVSDRYLASILQHAPDAIVALGKDARIDSWNRGAEAMFGFSEASVRGKSIHFLTAGDTGASVHAEIVALIARAAATQDDHALRREIACVRADDTELTLDLTLAPVYADNRELLGVALLGRDITQRKRQERRLALQYRIARVLAETDDIEVAVPQLLAALCAEIGCEYAALWRVDNGERLLPAGHWHAARAALAQFATAAAAFRFARGQGLPGRVWQDRRPATIANVVIDPNFPRAAAAQAAGLQSAVAWPVATGARVVGVIECLSVAPDLPESDLLAAVAEVTGQIAQFIERRAAEAALAAERELLAVTLQSIGDGVITTDTEGRVAMLNAVAQELTGWTAADAVGRPLNEVFHIVNEKTRAVCENPVAKVLETGMIVGLANHTALIARDGTARAIADSGAPIRGDDNRIRGVVLVFRDVTEQQRLEGEALKAQKLESVGVLAGGIAHDFNNILTAILGNVSLAKLYVGESQAEAVLTQAEVACDRARDLTLQLLTFARGGAPIKQAASIAELVRETASFALRGASVNVRFELEDDLWATLIDRGQISQVIQNLVINASQAMPNGGQIVIRGDNVATAPPPLEPGRYVRLTVSDHGVGILPEHLPRIFDPYFTTKQKGNGLGLATAYSIVQRHDGLITVDSTPGKGTRFTVYLPAALEENAHAPTATAVAGTGRVLLMDDEASVREVGAKLLDALGYQATLAADGEECLQIYAEALREGRRFDAVLLDLTVPGGMGGRECLERLRAVDAGVQAIVSSGYSNDPVMANHRSYGFIAVVAKPYDVAELSEALRQALHGQSGRG